MNINETILEFKTIKEMLCELAVSEYAKEQLSKLSPFINEYECNFKMNETTQARLILDISGNPPISSMKEIDKILNLCEKGYMLSPEQLENISIFISSCERMKNYLKKSEYSEVEISFYGNSIFNISELREEIEKSIQNSEIQNSASTELKNIRRKIENTNLQIKSKLETMIKNKKNMFSDSYISQRNGHFVMPVKKEYKNQISGTVIDISGTGGTYFIEPSIVSKLQSEISSLKIDEENEIRRILYELTSLVYSYISEIKINIETMVTLDIIFAKAKLSADMKAIPVSIDTERSIKIKNGRHPLLEQDKCIPLNFSIGEGINGVIITGPNTGGKTVALKTVGLLSMMAQSGLHVPVEEGKFCINNLILCDIGDGQSITENLSTFSAHITNIINILNTANQDSLVLLDELGSGTDPAEGMGIAISILEELRQKKCLFIATTHYPEIKEYASNNKNIINARMAFDRESLKPLYKLEIGEAGESCALYIAKRLGFPTHMLERAYKEAYHNENYKELFKFDLEIEENKNNNQNIPQIQKNSNKNIPQKNKNIESKFQIGDSVLIYPEKNLGIVFQTTDNKGNVGVQIKGKKFFINHKRIKLKVPAKELYPPDYDFSIIFDTVENRKIRHKMDRKYVKDLEIKIETNK